MTETAKERNYRETLEKTRDRLDGFEELYANKEVYYAFDELTGLVEKGLRQSSRIPDTTDKLSVEKLQEHLLPYKKEMVQKIIDEKMQLVTADEFLKLHKESLTAIRENDKLQEQLNTAKKALTEIGEIINESIHECDYSCDNHCGLMGTLDRYTVENIKEVITMIGGDDD